MGRPFHDQEPTVAESAYVDPEATVIGDVTIGPDATVLPGAVIRGDGGGEVVLRESANVQDNVTMHADQPGKQVVLEDNAAVGHNAIVHNATVGGHSLVGMHATVLDDVVLEPHSVVAASSLVLEGETIPSGALAAGSPADIVRDDLDPDNDLFETAAAYTERADGFRAGTERDR